MFGEDGVIVAALEPVELNGSLVGRVAEKGGVRVENTCVELDRAEGRCDHVAHVDERRIRANLEGVHHERADIALGCGDIRNRHGTHEGDSCTQKVGRS